MADDPLLDYIRSCGVETPSLADLLRQEPARGLELLRNASAQTEFAAAFDDGVLRLAESAFDSDPGSVFWICHNLAEREAARAPQLLQRFVRLFPKAPAAAIDALYYVCTNNPALLDRTLADLLVEHLAANAAQAFQALGYILQRRPELLRHDAVGAVVRNLGLQANLAFDLIREIAKQRPEETPLCALALFECLVREPHGWRRQEMLQDIVAIADRSHVRAGLDRALREPPATGSRPARTLLALLFRQNTRAGQRILLEALHLAAPWESVWDFLRFLAESSEPDRVSAAPAARFLEAVYRLHHLVPGHVFEELLARPLDLRETPPAPFPPDVAFLDGDPALSALHAKIAHLAARFGRPLRLAPLEDFRSRIARAEAEQRALGAAQTTRRRRRRESLEERLLRWSRGESDPRERRALAKKVADALRAQAVDIAQAAVESASAGAYRSAIREVLGRDVEPSAIDASVLPAFLYHSRLGRFPRNRRALVRLIEDRIERRPHDWLRNEPEARAWAERVRERQPSVRLERWRTEFRREYAYATESAARERQGRIDRDLEQTRALFGRLKVDVPPEADLAALRDLYLQQRGGPGNPVVLEEIAANLERLRLVEQQDAASDYDGRVALEVETDPFKVLFMGEHGFASCLSLRGVNVWGAVSNAVDIDKAVVWARDAAGNIVGRRLIALVPEGLLSYRTYSNRHGLALDSYFERFLAEYAAHCGTAVTHEGKPGPLLSDAWYDDGSV